MNSFEYMDFHIGLLIHSSCTMKFFSHASCHVVLHQKLSDRVHLAFKKEEAYHVIFLLVA